MTEERMHRRLAAILAADVVGYSRLMERDEAGTLEALKKRRTSILEPLLTTHHGRLVKVMGDGVLVEFASVVNAVQCAVELQERMAEANSVVSEARRIILRIGINLGDVMVEGRDLYGDGVNVAARLEGIADPGQICVSGSVYEQVKRKIAFGFDELGPRAIKNIAEPVHVYRVQSRSSVMHENGGTEEGALPLPAKPSIAVLPFTNLSNDPEQEYFVDGLTEDLITDLSRNAGLFVIASHSTFAYKGKSIDVRRIARDLGVRYLLEGSARRAAGRVRINVQLVDTLGGGHLWAERFDRSLEDIFAMQDEFTGKIVEALIGRLTAPPARNRPTNLEAYDLCVRGRSLIAKSPEAGRESSLLMQQAIALDPAYAEAHRWLAENLWAAWTHWGEPMEPSRSMAVAEAETAVALDPNDAGCRWVYGHMLAYQGQWAEADTELAAAVELDPSHADAWAVLADISVLKGQTTEAVERAQRALRLNPHPPAWYYWHLGEAQYAARQYESAVSTLRKEATYRTFSRRILAASLAQLGRIDEARHEAALFMAANRLFTISYWASTQPFLDEGMREHFVDGYRKAGLPE
ncbi:MAG: adenylate/guanylate cyclase domain-containing protein [Mesorhizobium sp.]|uniref:adenylate/guanylate cyclase domain-containing protein n=1 Tax=unclassified Mesorhizobium TaxID=325217 RepID=UPI000FEAB481|nr:MULTISPECIES: adenylate/guanylate cyclase domain-containing protein [unclassified Mesorhizobium]RWC23238.1 MAG: adenylate/guanylate cyclase domain-containing protein [Mesorhizobium sp.]TGT93128.1 adenylate/guanylate cyclase domain-containing protein [Mesorhizobium sp. M5C.F.Ca.ET.164.01.1.1]